MATISEIITKERNSCKIYLNAIEKNMKYMYDKMRTDGKYITDSEKKSILKHINKGYILHQKKTDELDYIFKIEKPTIIQLNKEYGINAAREEINYIKSKWEKELDAYLRNGIAFSMNINGKIKDRKEKSNWKKP